MKNAFQDAICGDAPSAPVICVYDNKGAPSRHACRRRPVIRFVKRWLHAPHPAAWVLWLGRSLAA